MPDTTDDVATWTITITDPRGKVYDQVLGYHRDYPLTPDTVPTDLRRAVDILATYVKNDHQPSEGGVTSPMP